MDEGWSPKLIAEVLARDHPNDRQRRVHGSVRLVVRQRRVRLLQPRRILR
jgi:hypothetical protein